jgi:hypothetical protein
MGKGFKIEPVNADCAAKPTGDAEVKSVKPIAETAAPEQGADFRYVGPTFANGCTYKGVKLYMDTWTEERAKAEIAKDEYLAKYFQF